MQRPSFAQRSTLNKGPAMDAHVQALIEKAAREAQGAASWLVVAKSWLTPNYADDDRDPELMLSQNLAKAELEAERALEHIRNVRALIKPLS